MKTTKITFDQLKKENPIFESFIELYGHDQNVVNEYTVGCIQVVNSLLPIIAKLLINQK